MGWNLLRTTPSYVKVKWMRCIIKRCKHPKVRLGYATPCIKRMRVVKTDGYERILSMANNKIAPQHNNKSKGNLYEQLFIYESFKRDLIPHKPIVDPSCHDVILMNSDGETFIVQVKSIKVRSYDDRQKKGCFKYTSKAMCLGDKIALKDTYVDAVALYTVNEKIWYIIPRHSIVSKTIAVFPHIDGSKGQYERFRENWSFFLGDLVSPEN